MSSSEAEREAVKAAFLAEAGLGAAQRTPLPGDASTRRYERLTLAGGRTLMLMDQPPSHESEPCRPDWDAARRAASGWNAVARLSAGRIEAFTAVADWLRGLGLSAPEIVAMDAAAGLAVLEDFGHRPFAELLAEGRAEEQALYGAAVDVLARLHEAGAPEAMAIPSGGAWPILDYDDLALKGGADLFVQWTPQLAGEAYPAEALAEWDALWSPWIARGAAGASVIAHRDYHAENLMWLDERQGLARVGLIDFQDAVRAHPGWDLHSLLQDARRDVSPELEAWAIDRYLERRPEIDREAFLADYAGLAALNEARILGVFARLIVRDGKPRYQAFMPRVAGHLRRNLERPEMAGLKAWFQRHAPEIFQ
ncbi:phosphotransferase [Brevundimonas sp. 2R-24]|uniref:Phosphotransferase n=1 Tax=Peiella sedimenti TaxID=3061083 RepID=A0ABT8SIL0_9CAUL|nr:phosphotransferase [Caulobacteraceae bacterium XZ-24]